MTSSVGSAPALGAVHPVTGSESDYDDLVERIGSRRVVLIGEASHGTHEFYRERARITRRLIDELGFTAVAVEGDWPDVYRVNRYVMGLTNDPDAPTALDDFERFPSWMWRNRDVVHFVEWLKTRNATHHDAATKARFYGLDLYSLRTSMEAVVRYPDRVDPDEAARASRRYSCFDHVTADGQAYGYALAFSGALPCENEVVTQLVELRRRAELYLRRDGWLAEDEHALPHSYEALLHEAEHPNFWIDTRTAGARHALNEPRLERAIGVVYRPETERRSHYFHARLALQFDAVLHIDRTRALEPLECSTVWTRGEPPETYPTGL